MTTTKEKVVAAPVTRSTAGIREMLFNEVERLRASISTPAEANAIARLAKEITATVKLELEAKKLSMKMADAETALPAPIDLGLKEPDQITTQ
jgi:hypothetical protein